MLKNGVALHTLELIAGKRKMVRIRRNVDARHWKQVKIHVAVHERTRPSDVQVPSPQGALIISLGFITKGRGGDNRRRSRLRREGRSVPVIKVILLACAGGARPEDRAVCLNRWGLLS